MWLGPPNLGFFGGCSHVVVQSCSHLKVYLGLEDLLPNSRMVGELVQAVGGRPQFFFRWSHGDLSVIIICKLASPV